MKPLNPAHGAYRAPQVAVVDGRLCIGCAKCIEACPTDAIVGARKWMHTVIIADCSGCELCIPPCPVDCIEMVASPGLPARPLDGASIAETNLRRFEQLFERKAASQLELDQMRYQYDTAIGPVAQAEGAVATASSSRPYAEIPAPFDGRVVDRLCEVTITLWSPVVSRGRSVVALWSAKKGGIA